MTALLYISRRLLHKKNMQFCSVHFREYPCIYMDFRPNCQRVYSQFHTKAADNKYQSTIHISILHQGVTQKNVFVVGK